MESSGEGIKMTYFDRPEVEQLREQTNVDQSFPMVGRLFELVHVKR